MTRSLTVRDPATGEEHEVIDLRACLACDDTGFVALTEAGHGTVKPCDRCLPATHERWSTGAYRPVLGR